MLSICGGGESDYCKAREEGKEAVREGGTEEGGEGGGRDDIYHTYTVYICKAYRVCRPIPFCPALPCPALIIVIIYLIYHKL